MKFDTEVWENIIVLGMGILIAILYLWNTMELRANRRAQTQNTELLRLWLLAFDSARKAGDIVPVCEPPENPNDNVLK